MKRSLLPQTKGRGLKFLPTRKEAGGSRDIQGGRGVWLPGLLPSPPQPRARGLREAGLLSSAGSRGSGTGSAVLPEAYTAISFRTFVFSWEERRGTVVG